MKTHKEPSRIKRTIFSIGFVFVCLIIPILGWFQLSGRLVKWGVNGISAPKGLINKKCSKCGSWYSLEDEVVDKRGEWYNFTCYYCGNHNRYLSPMLLGVYKHEEWTG